MGSWSFSLLRIPDLTSARGSDLASTTGFDLTVNFCKVVGSISDLEQHPRGGH